jgi:lysylphosphatidylglycerol synthetase-like protein (DUF2156 family)
VRESRIARLLTLVTAAAGFVALFARLPPFERWIASEGPPWLAAFEHLGHVASAGSGLFLVYLSGQLRRRRLRAWQLCTLLLALAVALNLLRGPRWASLAATSAALVLLLLARRSFTAPSDPPTLFRLLRFVPAWALLVLCFGVGSLWLERRQLTPEWTLARSLDALAWGLVGKRGPYVFANLHFDHFFHDALRLFGIAGAAGFLWLAFRPLVQRPDHSPEDWARARRLVETWGSDTLSFFALRRDKSFFYASDGGALVAYGYFGGYALASGDPIGAPASIPLVIREFVQHCRARGWGIAFLAVREETLPLYRAEGLHSAYLGDEAVLDCKRFDLESPELRKVRALVHKLLRSGYTFEWSDESEVSPETLARLDAISAVQHPGEEHGFTMALETPVSARESGLVLAIARNPQGVAEGFLRFVPCFGGTPGLSLDRMRRAPEAPNGITEFLIAQTALAARARGIGRLSLNFAAYGRFLEPGLPLSVGEKLLRSFVLRTDWLFQTRSLWSFNRKFGPDWLPRSLVFEGPLTFARVVLYYIVAEGFVRIPGIGRLLVAQPANRG